MGLKQLDRRGTPPIKMSTPALAQFLVCKLCVPRPHVALDGVPFPADIIYETLTHVSVFEGSTALVAAIIEH